MTSPVVTLTQRLENLLFARLTFFLASFKNAFGFPINERPLPIQGRKLRTTGMPATAGGLKRARRHQRRSTGRRHATSAKLTIAMTYGGSVWKVWTLSRRHVMTKKRSTGPRNSRLSCLQLQLEKLLVSDIGADDAAARRRRRFAHVTPGCMPGAVRRAVAFPPHHVPQTIFQTCSAQTAARVDFATFHCLFLSPLCQVISLFCMSLSAACRPWTSTALKTCSPRQAVVVRPKTRTDGASDDTRRSERAGVHRRRPSDYMYSTMYYN